MIQEKVKMSSEHLSFVAHMATKREFYSVSKSHTRTTLPLLSGF